VAGRHAAGQTTRRTPLTRETPNTERTSTERTPAKPLGRRTAKADAAAARGKKPEYRAKHALNRKRSPIVPLATAAAITVTVVGAAVGLAQADPGTAKAGDVEPSPQPASRETADPVSRSQARPSPSAKKAEAKKLRTVVVGSCKASFYDEPQGTASGERFDPGALTAAHRTWKMGTRVRVTNPRNGKSVVVRINDRGPYIEGRCLDLSRAAFAAIESLGRGVAPVRYEVLS
jgi:rare lipoprotein A